MLRLAGSRPRRRLLQIRPPGNHCARWAFVLSKLSPVQRNDTPPTPSAVPPASSAASARSRPRPSTQRVLRAASGFAALGVRPGRLRRAAAAQRFRVPGSLARRRSPRRLRRADQLALQGRRGRLRAGRLRRQGAGRPCRPAGGRRGRPFPPASRCSRSRRRRRSPPPMASRLTAAARCPAPPSGTRGSPRQAPWQGAPLPQTSSMIYTSGTTGRPKGVRRQPLTADLEARMAGLPRARLRPQARRAHDGPGAALSFRAQRLRAARRPRRQPDRADAALRSRGLPGARARSTASRPCSWCRPCSCGC